MNIKRLVLGTAAGALAVTGAQAADLPVVVEPVEYVRICDAYGTGFYYIPGTETCLRLAGRVRVDYQFFGDLSTFENGDELTPGRGYDDDGDLGYRFRARAYIYMDSRTSTEFGLLRTFTELQVNSEDGNPFSAVDVERAFIQFGGLTFGDTRSFFDYSDAYYGSFFFWNPEVSDTHLLVAAYTAAFGNGFSASISIEDYTARQTGVLNAYERTSWVPDLVANVRVDQGWGSAQIMGMVGYREAGELGGGGDYNESDSDIAFAIGGGVNVNVPFGNDTTVGIQATYARGAPSYLRNDFINTSDGYWDTVDNDLTLSEGFSVHGGFATSFTPALSLSLGAGYSFLDRDDSDFRGDDSQIGIDGYLEYEVVSGFVFGAGLQYEYVDTDNNGDASNLAGFLRAQRTF